MRQRGWVWLAPTVMLAVHDEQLAENGGAAGVRDIGLLTSAVDRPRNLAARGEPDAAELAAAYAFGIARNHPFVDGNTRTAFVALELFLLLNGIDLVATDAACVETMLALAAGQTNEADLAASVRKHMADRAP